MTSMSELRENMIADMTAAGLSASTKEVYVQGVRGLAAYYRRSPDQLTEGEVRSYLLHLRDECGVARGTYAPHHAGIQFLYAHTHPCSTKRNCVTRSIVPRRCRGRYGIRSHILVRLGG